MSKAAALASVLILTVAAFLVGRATSSPSASQPVATPAPTAVPTATPLPFPVGAGGRPIAADGGNTDLYPAPLGNSAALPPTAASWYVRNVILTTGQDVAPLLNAYGDKYHVWPVGLAATLGVESALNPNAERWAGGLDNSCGLAQQIITNVTYYTGIQSPRAACNWEEVPQNSIYLEARLYAEYFAYQHNCVSWPYAYGMYNGGPGYSCGFYYNTAGTDIGAHLQVFLGWYNYALAHWQSASPPPPPPTPQPKPAVFPRKAWCAWATGHHRGCPAIYEKHAGKYHLTWAASLYPHRTWLRGKLPYTRDHFTKARKPSGSGYMTYHWVKGQATCWVKWHRCSVKHA